MRESEEMQSSRMWLSDLMGGFVVIEAGFQEFRGKDAAGRTAAAGHRSLTKFILARYRPWHVIKFKKVGFGCSASARL